jgi:hypothetical protein
LIEWRGMLGLFEVPIGDVIFDPVCLEGGQRA